MMCFFLYEKLKTLKCKNLICNGINLWDVGSRIKIFEKQVKTKKGWV